jgi:hypothetical protein
MGTMNQPIFDFNSEEAWKPVVGFEGYYEVSSRGRVRAVFAGNHGQYEPGRILRPHISKNGYVRIELNAPGIHPVKRTIHSLVLEAFHGPRPEGKESRHLDGIRSNNGILNLEWGTKRENSKDQFKHGTRILGESHPMRKLDESTVREMRKLRASGHTYQRIADRFGVDQSNVALIVKGKAWKHVR